MARDVRGFAVKLYTQEGNWDIVGNNIPVFFIQDAIKFPDLIHAAKQEPDREFPQAQTAHDNFWDFISLTPESMHMVMWIMSDRAIPRSFRFMEGFGVHTFRLINAEGKSTFVKFHWKPKLGLQSVVWNEAVKINGADPDFHRRDLWNAIQMGDYPEWELGLQLFDEEFADNFDFDVLDATKLIPEEDVPVRRVGRLVLDRCRTISLPRPSRSHSDAERRARHRLYERSAASGTQFLLPRYPAQTSRQSQLHASSDQRAQVPLPLFSAGRAHGHAQSAWPGQLRAQFLGRGGGGSARIAREGFSILPRRGGGSETSHPARDLCRPLQPGTAVLRQPNGVEQKHIADALIFELSKVETPAIRARVVAHLMNIDTDLAKQVADGLRLKEMPKPADAAKPTRKDLKKSPALSILLNSPEVSRGARSARSSPTA